MPLVPGFTLYTSMLAFAQSNTSDGTNSLADAGVVSLAIAIASLELTVRIRRDEGALLGSVEQLDVEPVGVAVVVDRDDIDDVRFSPSVALVPTLSQAAVVSMLDPGTERGRSRWTFEGWATSESRPKTWRHGAHTAR